MNVSTLIKILSEYDPNLDVGVVVSFTEHCCTGDEYCYCSRRDHEYNLDSVAKEENIKKKIIKKLWIRGGE